MTLALHIHDCELLRLSTSSLKTPALLSLLDTKKSTNVSRVIQELRVIGRTGESESAELAREIVLQVLKADRLELEVGK